MNTSWSHFRDRVEAGRQLGTELARRGFGGASTIVLALPRGGVPIGFEVAQALDSPLDLFIVRKLGMPGQEELAIGAIASGGVRYLNQDVLRHYPVDSGAIDRVTQRELRELARREAHYRGGRPPLQLSGKRVIICDDGLATGSTMKAAVRALRQLQPSQLVVAVPVAAADTCAELRREVDEIVCLHTPEPFRAVGLWYETFDQTTDEEVLQLLARAAAQRQESLQ